MACFDDNADETHAVLGRAPNARGLYDLSGNVWEWTGDWYEASYPTGRVENPPGPGSGVARVLRGGGIGDGASNVRVANRGWGAPGYSWNYVGFRLARGVPGPASAP